MHCVNHMVQLRRDYQKFQELSCEVIVMVPNGPFLITKFRDVNRIPYPILTDRGARVAASYGIETKTLGIGLLPDMLTPSVFLVDRAGVVRHTNYCDSYLEEPENEAALSVLKQLVSA